MTFSNSKVRDLLNKRFTCTWINTEGDPNAGASFAHAPKDPAPTCIRGNGEHNIQILVMTPEREIFHVLAGYIEPDDLRRERNFALKLFKRLAKCEKSERADRVTSAYEDRIKELKNEKFDGPLGKWERRRARDDYRFVAKHPLLAVDKFYPEMLVGNGKSFFGSSNGKPPKKKIGDADARKLMDKKKKMHDD